MATTTNLFETPDGETPYVLIPIGKIYFIQSQETLADTGWFVLCVKQDKVFATASSLRQAEINLAKTASQLGANAILETSSKTEKRRKTASGRPAIICRKLTKCEEKIYNPAVRYIPAKRCSPMETVFATLEEAQTSDLAQWFTHL